MRKRSLIWIVTLVFGYLYVLPCQAQHALEGDWIGGIDFGSECRRAPKPQAEQRQHIEEYLSRPSDDLNNRGNTGHVR